MKWKHFTGIAFSDKTPIIIIVPGGHGAINMSADGKSISWGKYNFLVRNISMFLNNQCSVILIDAAPVKLTNEYRLSEEHGEEMQKIFFEIEKAFPKNKKTLVLNSAGALSISNVKNLYSCSKLIFLSPVFFKMSTTFNLKTLVITNTEDECEKCHHTGLSLFLENLSNHFEEIILQTFTSKEIEDNHCSGRSPHGFWGLDIQVVDKIIKYAK